MHLTADLYNCRCDAAWLTDAARLAQWSVQAVQAAGLQPVNQLFEGLDAAAAGGGVAGAVLLANSHVCLHTWPRQRSVTADVYICNAGSDPAARARSLMDAFVERFQPEWTEQRSLDRGSGDA